MLNESTVVAMAAVKDLAEAKQFYGDKLNLKLIDENTFGLTYKSGEGKLFVYEAPTAGTNQATTANWDVADIKSAVTDLKSRGVDKWEHYDYPGAEHDGEVHILSGFKSAWFKDPSGNTLGLTETGG
jgi:catechol 2,3-dioxygenase-like lactoylglutathione lyase family enzyme